MGNWAGRGLVKAERLREARTEKYSGMQPSAQNSALSILPSKREEPNGHHSISEVV